MCLDTGARSERAKRACSLYFIILYTYIGRFGLRDFKVTCIKSKCMQVYIIYTHLRATDRTVSAKS